MKASPVYPAFENGSSSAYEFDPRADFVQFLEEAKKNASNDELKAAQMQPSWHEIRQQIDAEKKQKKSWKSSLLSWWKSKKKKKHVEQSSNAPLMPKLKREYESGPMAGAITTRAPNSASGPLGRLFNSSKRVENEMPYMCLEDLNNPHHLHSYGPVYLVT
ncbi:hypothetical protein LIER_11417 [Lithospermum erythrorhizon]|uniref:Uncharacterized protein n=1 Tax=Lithospermum erythrorhizon TaxID=34254 RepID=A0AAV3PPS4_LITER